MGGGGEELRQRATYMNEMVVGGGGGGGVGAELMGLFGDDPLLWGKVYVANYFGLVTPWFHEKIINESMASRWLAVQSPRGSAKSTILSFLRVIHGICFKKFRFVVVVQNTQQKAQGTLDGIKKEFVDNAKVRGSFGVVMTKSAAHDTVFRHPDGFETRVMCFGQEQIGGIRGERFGAYRPDLIIIDDLEDDELVKNPDRRNDLKFLFDDALIPAGDFSKLCVFAIGTILHHDSLIARLVSLDEYKEYRKLFFMALYKGKNGEECSLWPEKWSVDDLKKMREEKPSTFAKEMQGNPTSGAMRKFDREDFRYWKRNGNEYLCYGGENEIVERGELRGCKVAVGCDLAWEDKRKDDDTAIVPCFLTPQNSLLVDDYIAEKGMRPDRLADLLFHMDKKYRELTGDVVMFGFEKAKLEKFSRWYIGKESRKRNHYLIMRSVPWAGDKIERITTRLNPMYSMHAIYHKHGMGKLEQQLVQFPEGVHDDLPDGLQSARFLLTTPKGKKKPVVEDDGFEKLRKFAIASKFHVKHSFGKPRDRFPLPHAVCPI